MSPTGGIGFLQHLNRVKYIIRQWLVELQPAAQAVRYNSLGVEGSDFFHERASQLNGSLMILALETHDARQTTAIESAADNFQVDAGDRFEQLHIGLSDLLFSQMTGRIVDHAALDRAEVC